MRKSNSPEYKTPPNSHKPQMARSAGRMQPRAKGKTTWYNLGPPRRKLGVFLRCLCTADITKGPEDV